MQSMIEFTGYNFLQFWTRYIAGRNMANNCFKAKGNGPITFIRKKAFWKSQNFWRRQVSWMLLQY